MVNAVRGIQSESVPSPARRQAIRSREGEGADGLCMALFVTASVRGPGPGAHEEEDEMDELEEKLSQLEDQVDALRTELADLESDLADEVADRQAAEDRLEELEEPRRRAELLTIPIVPPPRNSREYEAMYRLAHPTPGSEPRFTW